MLLKLGKYRLVYSYVMAILIIAFAPKDLYYPGLILVAIGAIIRIWAAGYIMKKNVLAQEGPYSYTRNPLYLGSFIAAVGTLVLIKNWQLALIFVLGFAIFYGGKIMIEEIFLRDKFGIQFDEYMKNVPVFLPKITPYKKLKEYSFSWRMVINNDEHYSILYTIVSVLAIIMVSHFRK